MGSEKNENKRMVPLIRFKGFAHAWEQRKLSGLTKRVKSYPLSRDVQVDYMSGYKYVHYGDIHTRVVDMIKDDAKLPDIKPGNYELLSKGDVILADASEDYEDIAAPAVLLANSSNKIVSGLHTIALRPSSELDSLYLYYQIKSPEFRKYGRKQGQGLKVFGISASKVQKYDLPLPVIAEQTKISLMLNSMDSVIALHQRKLDLLQKMKKGYLQSLFPKNGEKTPEIRFAGFTDAWEQRKSSEIFKNVSSKGHPEKQVLSASQEDGMVPRDKIGIDIKYDRKSLNGYKLVLPGQFVIHLRSFQGGFAYSSVEGITSPAYTVMSLSDESKQIPEFWKEVLRSPTFINRLVTVTYGIRDGRSISFSDFGTLKFQYPSVDEQKSISNVLRFLDKTIALHQRKLDALKEIKQGLLQKMFV